MGALGMQRVQQNYDWKVVLNRYSDLLDDLLREIVKHAIKRSEPREPGVHEANSSIITDLRGMAKPRSRALALRRAEIKSTSSRHLQLGMVMIYRNELPPTTLILKAFPFAITWGTASLQQLDE